jgi:AbrB family looped-hinge helix DNA binding protein
MAVTLTEKGQITIPLAIRKRLGLKAGMRLVFDETVPFLKATREVDIERMRSTIGCLNRVGTPEAKRMSSAEMMQFLRGDEDEA